MKIKSVSRVSILFLLLNLVSVPAVLAQISLGGIPLSFSFSIPPDGDQPVSIPPPAIENLLIEDMSGSLPYRYAVNLPVDIGISNSGKWITVPGGLVIWRVTLKSIGARALTLYFDDFRLPEEGRLFVYNPKRTNVIGAFTSVNNNEMNSFATELISGDQLTIEYDAPSAGAPLPDLHISEIAFAYRGFGEPAKGGLDFGQAGHCEVNINCPEGTNWQTQKKGVTRISVKQGNASYWCSGSLINNVRNDRKPYLLTADHCGQNTTAFDISRWIFYFNYETTDCENPILEPFSKSITGASLVAHGGNGGDTGSDFFLVLLKNNIPSSFNAYFNGWSREVTPSPSGSGIHHPEGDIKKISTYTTPLQSSSWSGHPFLSHWRVVWTGTSNGHGVTEPGSSGSPIFDNSGHIVGTLTGGDSSCDTAKLNEPDYYGKFSYHWDQNGTDSASVLKYWLDPDNTNTMVLNGLYVSVEEVTGKSALNVFPNPFSDRLTINGFSISGGWSLTIIDLLGNEVFHQKYTNMTQYSVTIDVGNISPGLYFLKVGNNREFHTIKIIKHS